MTASSKELLEEEYAKGVKAIWAIPTQAPFKEKREANEARRVEGVRRTRAIRRQIGEESAKRIITALLR